MEENSQTRGQLSPPFHPSVEEEWPAHRLFLRAGPENTIWPRSGLPYSGWTRCEPTISYPSLNLLRTHKRSSPFPTALSLFDRCGIVHFNTYVESLTKNSWGIRESRFITHRLMFFRLSMSQISYKSTRNLSYYRGGLSSRTHLIKWSDHKKGRMRSVHRTLSRRFEYRGHYNWVRTRKPVSWSVAPLVQISRQIRPQNGDLCVWQEMQW